MGRISHSAWLLICQSISDVIVCDICKIMLVNDVLEAYASSGVESSLFALLGSFANMILPMIRELSGLLYNKELCSIVITTSCSM